MLADAIVEATETGSTLRANRLRILDTVMESNTQLIANQTAMADPWKRTKIENLALLLKAAIEAQGRVGLMLNVQRADLDQLLALLPALQRPTVSSLSDPDWVAVNTIIEERTVRDLIPKLKVAGGQGIVEYPLNKIVCRRDGSRRTRMVTWRSGEFEHDQDRLHRPIGARSAAALGDARFAIAPPKRRAPAIVERVRRGGDAALQRYARRARWPDGPLEVPRREMGAAARDAAARRARAIAQAAAATSDRCREAAGAAGLAAHGGAGHHRRAARHAARPRRLLRARRAAIRCRRRC